MCVCVCVVCTTVIQNISDNPPLILQTIITAQTLSSGGRKHTYQHSTETALGGGSTPISTANKTPRIQSCIDAFSTSNNSASTFLEYWRRSTPCKHIDTHTTTQHKHCSNVFNLLKESLSA